MSNTAKIRRQGGATVFSIPPALLKMLGAEVGTELTLTVDNGSLVATPAQPKKRYTLAQLLEGADEMADLNKQAAAWQGGPRVGNENILMVRSNIPKRGDVFIVDLNPVVGNEMKDEHRCVVITPREINAVGMCLVVPITTGGAFARRAGLAVNISGHKTTGVALCNQVRGLDIVERVKNKTARFIETLDSYTTDEIAARVVSMIDPA